MHLKRKKFSLNPCVLKILFCTILLSCSVQCGAKDNFKNGTSLVGSTYNVSDVLKSVNTSVPTLEQEHVSSDFTDTSNDIGTTEQTGLADENDSPDNYTNKSSIRSDFYDDYGSHNINSENMQNNNNTNNNSSNEHQDDYQDYDNQYDEPENKTKFDLSVYDCDNNTCVTKCCPLETILSFKPPDIGCVHPLPEEPEFKPKYTLLDGRVIDAPKQVLFIIGFPHDLSGCDASPVPEHRTTRLLEDGRLFTPHDDTQYREVDEYCIDIYRNMDGPTRMNAVTCYTEYKETARSLFRFYSHTICLIISCMALMLMVMFHAFIPQFRDFQ